MNSVEVTFKILNCVKSLSANVARLALILLRAVFVNLLDVVVQVHQELEHLGAQVAHKPVVTFGLPLLGFKLFFA